MMLQRYIPCNHYCIDHLIYRYTDNGQPADQYDVIEYPNGEQADTIMRYDANGNMLCDSARMISAVHYNIINLPDTIQFLNGNQIVNLYDAAGRKYKSIAYIVQETAVTPRYEIVHYTFDVDTIDYIVTEYAGNIETRYTRTDTITQKIHNSIGYYTDSTYYHYIKDHLGNVCAVVHSTADTLIQSTLYYASGVPMAQSFGRDKQPYLYNSKEFIEAHGLNTYDYGFRGYYATIGRFTTIDPLAESTPWQSPYSYANNNFVNNIDYMGLSAYTTSNPVLIAKLFGHLAGGGSVSDFDTSGWDDTTDEWKHGFTEEFGNDWWLFECVAGGGSGGGWGGEIATVGMTRVLDASKFADYCKAIGEYAEKIGMSSEEALSFGINAWVTEQWNPFNWEGANGVRYTREFLHKRGGYANSFKKAGERVLNSKVAKFGTKLSYVSVGLAVADIYYNGLSIRNGIDFGVAVAGVATTFVAGPELLFFCTVYGFADIGVTCLTGNSISGWIDYGVHQGINYFTEEY